LSSVAGHSALAATLCSRTVGHAARSASCRTC
jgi:hypothetical protein